MSKKLRIQGRAPWDPVESWHLLKVRQAGGGAADLDALRYAHPGTSRKHLCHFLCAWNRWGSLVMPALLADLAATPGGQWTKAKLIRSASKDLPKGVRDFLSRGDWLGFIVALGILHPETMKAIRGGDTPPRWTGALRLSEWNPSVFDPSKGPQQLLFSMGGDVP